MFGFTEDELRRYSRQIVLKDVGGTGQKKLRDSSVLIVGVGGLGCPAAFYLTAAGIGRIGLLDFDTVDLSNLQRQILHFTSDVNRAKTRSATEKLSNLNPNVVIDPLNIHLTPQNVRSIIGNYDYVIDGSDNFATKFLINDACILEEIPFTIAGILQFEGQILTVLPKKTACYRCIFPKIPAPGQIPNCSQAGVFGVIPGIVGSIQASEAIKYLLGIGKLITDSLLIIDIKNLYFQLVSIQKTEECKACGKNAQNLLLTASYSQENSCEI
ncbi:MAG: HesA/MoeB/ThiF family protein [Candidatus Helarchaeota archaeon]